MTERLHTEFQPQLIAPSAYIAAGATVLGDVTLGEHSSVWFGAVLRGDTSRIVIGARSNVQDLCVVHADPGFPALIGADVTLGHGAIVHGARVENGSMIGIRATVLNGAVIEEGCLIGAGAVVPEGSVIPAGHLALGVPAKVIRPLNEQDLNRIRHASQHYVQAAMHYKQSVD